MEYDIGDEFKEFINALNIPSNWFDKKIVIIFKQAIVS